MSDISQIKINGILYSLSDTTARTILNAHIDNNNAHVSDEERELWNSGRVVTKTAAEWGAETSYIPEAGFLCVYSDYLKTEDSQGNPVYTPALKVGDGKTYLIDLPFISGTGANELLNEHINNKVVHIENSERVSWNEKISCGINEEDPEEIIFFY